MRLLVFGSNGQLGRCMQDQLNDTRHEIKFYSSKEVDVTIHKKVQRIVKCFKPEVIINTSAYTAVENAECHVDHAHLVNHLAVENIAKICRQLGIWLIHYSTDYVFDGEFKYPYTEDHPVNPTGVYGASKLLGEQAVRRSGCRYFIIRTSWVFSEYGNNFLKKMLGLGSLKKELKIVDDQIGCPTYGQDIAKATVSVLGFLKSENSGGLFHFCGNEKCSWYEFAKEIFHEAEKMQYTTPDRLIPISSEEFPSVVKRPSYSVLDNCKIFRTFGISPSDWKAGIPSAIKKLEKELIHLE